MAPDLEQQYILLSEPAPAPGPADWDETMKVILEKI